jgi:lysophospholipase L1-like esterase
VNTRDSTNANASKRRIVFSAVTTGVVIGVIATLEIVSRALFPVEVPLPLVTNRRTEWSRLFRYDYTLFWALKANVEFEDVHTNSLGLRGPEVSRNPDAEYRILSLGESSTFARRVPYEDTYSSRLQSMFKSIDDLPSRVINAGVPGYTICQGYYWLLGRGLDLEPDAVFLYFGYNDYLPVSFRERRDTLRQNRQNGLTDRELITLRRKAPSRFLVWLWNHSNIARYLSFGRDRSEDVVRSNPDKPRVPETDRRWFLQRFVELSKRHQFRLVIIVPWYRNFSQHGPVLREFANCDEVIVVDLPNLLTQMTTDEQQYFFDDIHPTSTGHRIIAEAIYDRLKPHWQPGPPGPYEVHLGGP